MGSHARRFRASRPLSLAATARARMGDAMLTEVGPAQAPRHAMPAPEGLALGGVHPVAAHDARPAGRPAARRGHRE